MFDKSTHGNISEMLNYHHGEQVEVFSSSGQSIFGKITKIISDEDGFIMGFFIDNTYVNLDAVFIIKYPEKKKGGKENGE